MWAGMGLWACPGLPASCFSDSNEDPDEGLGDFKGNLVSGSECL